MTDNQIQEAKDISVMSVMLKAGYKPARETSSRAQFSSPFRGEGEPSLMVDKVKNRWKDWGDPDKYGDSIELVRQIEGCSFKDAVAKLLGKDDSFTHHVPIPQKDIEPTGIEILSEGIITDPYLISYAKSRAIDTDLLRLYCSEVLFRFRRSPDIVHRAIGFKNDKGGYELRNHKHKKGNSPKTWSTIDSRVAGDGGGCDMFEGFFDFLSHLQLHGWEAPLNTTYVLNSLVYAPFVADELEDAICVNLYLDNDNAADRYINDYFQGRQYHLMHRFLYPDFEDYNDFVKFKLLENG